MNLGIGLSLTSFQRVPTVPLEDLDAAIAALFGSGEVGAWYDPSDSTTVFQDYFGTTAAGVGDPVGLILDKSQGLAAGSPELFDGVFEWTEQWTNNGDGSWSVSSAGTDLDLRTYPGMTLGKNYILTFDLTITSGQVIAYNAHTAPNLYATTSGAKKSIQVSATQTWIVLRAVAGTTATISNISSKELPGNHATQTTSAARPVLSARANLITYSEQLNHGDWLRYGVAVSANAGVAPDATTTADLVYATSTGTVRSLYRGGLPVTSKRHRYYAKASGKTWFCILAESTAAGGVWFDLATGSLGTVSAGWTASIESAGNDWYVCTATSTASFNQYTAIGPVDADNSVTVTASGTDGVLVWGADVRTAGTGSSVPAYQQITDASTYNTVGFPRYLDFDGVDDAMVATFASVQAQPNTTAFAGLASSESRYFYDSSDQSRGDARNAFLFTALTNAQPFAGNIQNVTVDSMANASVLTVYFSGFSSYLRQNGAVKASSINLGALGSDGITLGNRYSLTNPLDGRIYSFVNVCRTLTAGEITDLESYLAAKSGVIL